jgi:hypothetical protein
MNIRAVARFVRIFVVASSAAAVAAIGAPSPSAAQTDPLIGVWKFNPAKSKGYMAGGDAARSQIRIIQPSGQGLIQVISTVSEKDVHAVSVYTIVCDGQPHPVVSFPGAIDANVCRRSDPYTRQFTNSAAGKQSGPGTMAVTRDGRTMTVTFADGAVAVFDKQ